MHCGKPGGYALTQHLCKTSSVKLFGEVTKGLNYKLCIQRIELKWITIDFLRSESHHMSPCHTIKIDCELPPPLCRAPPYLVSNIDMN